MSAALLQAHDVAGATEASAVGRRLHAPTSLRGALTVPSDKSIAHRALIACAVAAGSATIALGEPGDDVLSTVRALRSLGVAIDTRSDEAEPGRVTFRLTGLGDAQGVGRLGPGDADCGNSGTTIRLLAGALASGAGSSRLTGDASLSRRPMERIAEPLRAMAAEVRTTGGHAPLLVRGRRPLLALDHDLPVASAQVLGAIALAALSADGRTRVRVPGPTRDHTERMLSSLGAPVTRADDGNGTTLTTIEGPAGLRARSLDVPGDVSAAAVWLVAATLHPAAEVRVNAVGLNPTRTAFLDVLRGMGADIEVRREAGIPREAVGEPAGELVVRSADRLRAVSLGPEQVPGLVDELPLLAVAMAAADGPSEVRGASELRVKESDRIAAMARALSAVGARVEELPDGWRIAPGRPREAFVRTDGDHRIAMALAVAAWSGVARSVLLDDTACVAVSYPSFWRDAAVLGAMS